MMVKSDRSLDQGLKKLSIGFGRIAPNLFQNFMAFEECSLIKQRNTAKICLGIH